MNDMLKSLQNCLIKFMKAETSNNINKDKLFVRNDRVSAVIDLKQKHW